MIFKAFIVVDSSWYLTGLVAKIPPIVKPEEANIIALVQKNAPPTLILHGDNDKIVNVNTVRNFTRKMKAFGNNCTLIEYKNQPHGFFNYGRGNNENYYHTMSAIDSFLKKIDFLSPFPETYRRRNEQ